MGLSTEDEVKYRGNVRTMLALLSDSGKSALSQFGATVMLTSTIVLFSVAHLDVMLYILIGLNVISARSFAGVLSSICDPYKVASYKDKFNFTDDEFMGIYSNLKRPQVIVMINWISYIIQVYAIMVYANMFYMGLIWLVTCVLVENSIHNNNQKMKCLWVEQNDRSTS